MADGELTAKEGGGERKRKRGAEFSSSSSSSSQSAAAEEAKWRTEGEQRTYSSRLIAALRRVRSSPPAASDRAQSRALREAADRALAVSARGRTRWSRAILLSGKVRSLKRSRVLRPRAATRPPKPPASAAAGSSRPPALEKKTRVLGRLVPGCRKLPLPSLLEEVSDYIKALQMQVRAMSAIAEVLSAASTTPSPPPPPPPPPPQPM